MTEIKRITLQEAYETLDDDACVDLLADLIEKKLAEKGVTLDENAVFLSHTTDYGGCPNLVVTPMNVVFERLIPVENGEP